jgi:hypothetical protein
VGAARSRCLSRYVSWDTEASAVAAATASCMQQHSGHLSMALWFSSMACSNLSQLYSTSPILVHHHMLPLTASHMPTAAHVGWLLQCT